MVEGSQLRPRGRTGRVLWQWGFEKAGESRIHSSGWRTASGWTGECPGNPTRETFRGQITRATALAHTYRELLWSGAVLSTLPATLILQICKQRPREVK